jgi:glycosyltransferase involved in cell wall biosynthesis
LVQSRAFESSVKDLASGTPIIYYPNSVDQFFAMPFEGEIPVVDGFDSQFPVMFAGNIGAAQGVDVIVDAARLLRDNSDVHFIVMGDGSSRENMIRLAHEYELTNIHFPGRYPVEMMPGFMNKAAALLVTLTDKPIFSITVPNKIQAYLATGRPIIACLNGEGARLVVESGAGLAVPAEDAEALAKAVMSIYEMSADQQIKMGSKGRSFYLEHFDHEMLVDQLIGHLHPLLPEN